MALTRVANVAVVGAVAVVVAAAGVDAFRGGHAHRPPPALRPAADALARAHARGTLYYVDARCRLHALRLPSLVAAPAPRVRACSVAVAPHRLSSASWSLWRPGARLVAFCRRGRVLVRAERGPTLPFIVGCAPAWGPRGALTLVRHGSVVQFVPHGRAEVVLPARGIREVAWLGSRVAVLEARRVVIFDGALPSAEQRVAGRRVGMLRASPLGTRLSLVTGRRVLIFDGELRLRRSLAGAAVAWSPDEHDLAIARGARIVVEQDGRTVATIPLRARDLAWR
ncbi:MAG TPA: hypothetical protein VF101_16915 [Gaiellaceae bacterium]